MGSPNMFNGKTGTIANTDVVLALILISPDIQIGEISGEVMSGARVSIPLVIRSSLWCGKESLLV